ncbi:MAG TPA: Glu/Leu/Phe/Val dehydrogenase, partial [Candidatus Limnocylindrales bacterium]|nr:Glu/Leu/Phe/Val dehydrogenase [Candidatus Limnocylindrales bacterium]
PDVNTNAQTMAWIMDTFSMHSGYTISGVVTGKPIAVGGSLGRNEATARGAVFTLLQASKSLDMPLAGARVSIQGYGNAGSVAADLLAAEGSTIIAVSDSTGGIFNAKGLDPARVSGWKREHGTVVGFPGSEEISNEAVLEVECEILVPAALENQITHVNAAHINARVVAEAANGPTTPEADAILHDRGIFVIPDILCNAGGVTVSYFEWVQDMQSFFWTEERINQSLKEIMDRAFEAVHGMSHRHNVDMRTAAYMVAVARVAEATTLRGLYP